MNFIFRLYIITSLFLFSVVNISAQEWLFYGDQSNETLNRHDLATGTPGGIIATGQGIIRRVRIDEVNEMIYWVEGSTGQIWRSNYDGSNMTSLLNLNTSNLNVIELDFWNNRILYTVTNDGFIRSIDFNGLNNQVVVSGVGNVQGVDYDPICDKIYWTEYNAGDIKRSNGDGTEVEIVASISSNPFDIFLDINDRKLYITDRTGNTIWRGEIDGTNLEPLIVNSGNIGTVTIDFINNRIFWVHNDEETIFKANLDGTNIEPVIIETPSNLLAGIDVDFPLEVNFMPPTFRLGNDTSFCIENSFTISFDNPDDFTSFEWQDGSQNSSLTVNQSGTYWLEVETIGGCKERDSINVEFGVVSDISLGNDTILCTGESLILNVPTGNFSSFEWQNGDGGSSFLVNQPGIYWVEGTTAEGCIDRDSISIFYLSGGFVELGEDTIICIGDTLIIGNVYSGVSSYMWQDGSDTPSFSVTESGEYILNVSFTNGCSASDTIVVDAFPLFDFSLGNDTLLCNGDNLLLESPIMGEYEWQDGSSGESFLVENEGLFWVSIEANGFCKSSDTVLIDYQNPVLDLGDDRVICDGDVVTISIEDVLFTEFLWQDGSSASFLDVDLPGMYSVTGTTLAGCTASDTIIVSDLDLIFSLGNDTTICEGETLLIGTNDYPDAIYEWQDGADTPFYNVQNEGIYIVKVTLDAGCERSDTILISNLPYLDFDLGMDTILCPGDSMTLSVPIANVTYEWQDGSDTQNIKVGSTGEYNVTVQAEGYCESSDLIFVDYYNYPIDFLGDDLEICFEDTVVIGSIFPNATYEWSRGENIPEILVYEPGNYSVKVMTEDGCVIEDSLIVSRSDVYNDFLPEDTVICFDDTLILESLIEADEYLWQDGSVSRSLEVEEQGIYILSLLIDDCVFTDTAEVEIQENFTVEIGNDTTICEGEELFLESYFSDASYLWQDSSTLAFFQADAAGTYRLEVSRDGCTNQDSFVLSVIDCTICNYYIPNAFSPNADGVNDYFQIYSNCELMEERLRIYNRWGAVVYDQEGQDVKWNGRFNEELVQSGVYVFMFEFAFVDGQDNAKKMITGDLTVLR